jgi:hypothetical protein
MTLVYQTVQIFYWLVLAIWLGGIVFLAIAAPVIFRTVRRLDVRSGKYTDPNLIDEQTAVVAGEVVGMLLARLGQVQMVCATALLPLMIAQLVVADMSGTNFMAAILRFVLWAVAVGLLLYEWRSHYPRTWELRRRFLADAGDPEKADGSRAAFEREHRRSEQLFLAMICIVIGMVMLSANITPRVTHSVPAPAITR